jgi:hypothetical protein
MFKLVLGVSEVQMESAKDVERWLTETPHVPEVLALG